MFSHNLWVTRLWYRIFDIVILHLVHWCWTMGIISKQICVFESQSDWKLKISDLPRKTTVSAKLKLVTLKNGKNLKFYIERDNSPPDQRERMPCLSVIKLRSATYFFLVNVFRRKARLHRNEMIDCNMKNKYYLTSSSPISD